MHFIDRWAYTNRLRSLAPGRKLTFTLTILAICLVADQPLVGVVAAAGLWAFAVMAAGLPGRVFGRLLLAEAVMLTLMVVGVALSFTSEMQPNAVWQWQVGPFWLISSPAALDQALRLMTRALGGAAAMNFLALTTPLPDLVELLQRWRFPTALIDVMMLTYRFVFTLLESLERMVIAQDSRLGYSTRRRALRSAGLLGGRLFMDAYRRSQRLQVALDSRGYNGELRVLPPRYSDIMYFSAGAAGLVVVLLGVWFLCA
jgi:cobalt/nickel transport system permease protein